MSDATLTQPMNKPMSFKDLKPYDVFIFEEAYPYNTNEYMAIVTPSSDKNYLYFKVFEDYYYTDTKAIPLGENFLTGTDFKYYLHTSYADDPILDTMNKFPEYFI